jgi:hypothetical protein
MKEITHKTASQICFYKRHVKKEAINISATAVFLNTACLLIIYQRSFKSIPYTDEACRQASSVYRPHWGYYYLMTITFRILLNTPACIFIIYMPAGKWLVLVFQLKA